MSDRTHCPYGHDLTVTGCTPTSCLHPRVPAAAPPAVDPRDNLRCAGACGYCDNDLNCPYVGTLDRERVYIPKVSEDK